MSAKRPNPVVAACTRDDPCLCGGCTGVVNALKERVAALEALVSSMCKRGTEATVVQATLAAFKEQQKIKPPVK